MTDYDSMVERCEPPARRRPPDGAACSSRSAHCWSAPRRMPLLPVSRVQAASVKEEGDPRDVRVLALLRDRRFSVRLLRRLRDVVSARHRARTDHVGRHLPQCRRRPQLHRFVQRLLRQELLRTLSLQPQRGRRTALPAARFERLQLVCRQQLEHSVSLQRVAHHRRGRPVAMMRCCPAVCSARLLVVTNAQADPSACATELPAALHGLSRRNGCRTRRQGAVDARHARDVVAHARRVVTTCCACPASRSRRCRTTTSPRSSTGRCASSATRRRRAERAARSPPRRSRPPVASHCSTSPPRARAALRRRILTSAAPSRARATSRHRARPSRSADREHRRLHRRRG